MGKSNSKSQEDGEVAHCRRVANEGQRRVNRALAWVDCRLELVSYRLLRLGMIAWNPL